VNPEDRIEALEHRVALLEGLVGKVVDLLDRTTTRSVALMHVLEAKGLATITEVVALMKQMSDEAAEAVELDQDEEARAFRRLRATIEGFSDAPDDREPM
jgi:hypothetical protein